MFRARMLILALIFSPSLQAEPQYCLALRGNGEFDARALGSHG